jgi:hypothetical protein
LDLDRDTLPGINVRADTLAMLASYGITDRVMVSGVLPYIHTRYKGAPSHRPPGTPPGTPPPPGSKPMTGRGTEP